MKIYIACPEPNDLHIAKHVLFSYYDIYISTLPFRKKSFTLMKENENILSRNSGN
jgi:hypothetical protein